MADRKTEVRRSVCSIIKFAYLYESKREQTMVLLKARDLNMASRGKMDCSVFNLFFILYLSFYCSNGENVPVYIWGDVSDSSLPSSAMDQLTLEQFRENYLKPLAKEKVVVVFAQDELSSEDLSMSPEAYPNLKTELNKPSIILPSVNDPLLSLKSTGNDVLEMDAADLNDNRLDNSDLKPKILVVYLHPTKGDRLKALKQNDEVIGSFLKSMGDTKYVAIYTGKKPTMKPDPEYESLSRRVRAAATLSENLMIYTYNGNITFFAYGTNATIKMYKLSNKIDDEVVLSWPPKVEVNSTAEIINGTISLDWPFEDSGNFTAINLKISFMTISANGFWAAPNASLSFKYFGEDETAVLNTPYTVGASNGFSFSCNNVTFSYTYVNESINEDQLIQFKIERFQVELDPKNQKFADSFDCQTFFTLPLWMGLFVVILFTLILAVGVFMLFEVKTMDRFDDPKGKTISVPLTD